MVLTTTPNIENFQIVDYLGIVTGIDYRSREALGFSDALKVEKHKEAFEKAINDAKETAFQKLKENAKKLGANAVVGIETDIEITSQYYKIVVSVTGTAVKVQ